MMELFPYLVPTELERLDTRLPADFGPIVKLATTLEAAIRVAKSREDIVKGKVIDQAKAGKKKISEGLPNSNKKSKFSTYEPNNERSGCNNEAKWCDKYMKKHFERCDREVARYKYGKVGHYSEDSTFKNRIYYECGDKSHISKDCPRKEQHARALQTTLGAIRE